MRRALAFALTAFLCALPATAGAFTVTGRFLYEDRVWDKDGYTGQVQNLPIRRAKVEVVNLIGGLPLATGATDTSGFYSLNVTGQVLPPPAQPRLRVQQGTSVSVFVARDLDFSTVDG